VQGISVGMGLEDIHINSLYTTGRWVSTIRGWAPKAGE